jgi:hypothetical protein
MDINLSKSGRRLTMRFKMERALIAFILKLETCLVTVLLTNIRVNIMKKV